MSLFKNKKILITGGTGSLGKELVRNLLKFHDPAIVRIYDVDETEQFDFQHELKGYEDTVRFLPGDVRDKDRLNRAAEGIDIIFHTVALKTGGHVTNTCSMNLFVISIIQAIELVFGYMESKHNKKFANDYFER